jgi:cell pole-organizing protein PopZ
MEEILASIRKIISEDSGEPQPVQPPPAPQARAVVETHDADVLELTQEVHEEPPPVPPPPPAPVFAAAPPPAEPVADDVEFQPIEETPVNTTVQPPLSTGEGIFSEKTRKALSDAFANVDPEPQAKSAPDLGAPVAPIDGRTIEAVFDNAVRQAFNPVLQNWLDQNADAVVERMKPVITQWLEDRLTPQLEQWVREEVAAVAKQRVGR